MKKIYLLLAAGAVALGGLGCDKGNGEVKADEKPRSAFPADNTGRNVRERDTTELTPKDQSNDATDLQITQDIRTKVMDDSALSLNAKNVKIITQDRIVTLKGAVKDDAERQNVLEKARSVGTVNRVDDQLDVETK